MLKTVMKENHIISCKGRGRLWKGTIRERKVKVYTRERERERLKVRRKGKKSVRQITKELDGEQAEERGN